MRVAVAGGTGLTGRHVVDSLARGGHQPVVLSRSSGVDLVTGAGLAAALAGVDAVIDVSNVTTTRRAVAERFFTAATTHLRDAAAAAGVGHYVLLSIVGVLLTSDGGGVATAARRPVLGADRVARFLLGAAHRRPVVHHAVTINGQAGYATTDPGGELLAVCALTARDGRVVRVDLIMSPAKLPRTWA